VIKREVLKFGRRSSSSIGEKKVTPFATTRNRDRVTCYGGGRRLTTARGQRRRQHRRLQRGGKNLRSKGLRRQGGLATCRGGNRGRRDLLSKRRRRRGGLTTSRGSHDHWRGGEE
jgi:hypothetical protein